MKQSETIQTLQASVRRLRFGLIAMTVGLGVLGLGAMTQEDEISVGPHLVGITASSATMPAHTALFRLWSNGRIDRKVVQTDTGQIGGSWVMIQRP
ncbi:MAG: hypothetical protein VX527_05650 [Planctomycetota bacterium]|nr:hypothetical protein [Planctomycetota bacterium]